MRNTTETNYKIIYFIDRLKATAAKTWLREFKLNRLVSLSLKEYSKEQKKKQ